MQVGRYIHTGRVRIAIALSFTEARFTYKASADCTRISLEITCAARAAVLIYEYKSAKSVESVLRVFIDDGREEEGGRDMSLLRVRYEKVQFSRAHQMRGGNLSTRFGYALCV